MIIRRWEVRRSGTRLSRHFTEDAAKRMATCEDYWLGEGGPLGEKPPENLRCTIHERTTA